MSWRDQLRKASFRGVEFFVDTAESALGRRTVTHEYPLRDKPYVEDLGRLARKLTLEAYVLATPANAMNYMPGRDALIAALEEAGPATLSHPYLGELRVSCVESRMRETTAEGGMARFTLTLVESGEATFPAARANTGAAVEDSADAALVAAQDDFADKFGVEGLPEFVSASATSALNGVGNAMSALSKTVTALPDQAVELVGALTSFSTDLSVLIRSPVDLASRVTDLAARLPLIAATPVDALRMLRGMFRHGLAGSISVSTQTRVAEGRNLSAVSSITQRAAVIEAARVSNRIEFDALQDAAAVRTELADELDRLMEAEGAGDDVYQALAALRAAMVTDITLRGANLARLVSFTPLRTMPALAIAYDFYEDAGRDAEIVARNRIRHPGFVPGGRALELLANA